MDRFIVTAAITGSIHTPTMSPHLPITPRQIADEAVRAHEVGAAVAHIYVRDPETGMPSPAEAKKILKLKGLDKVNW